jgi:hypothetical protein
MGWTLPDRTHGIVGEMTEVLVCRKRAANPAARQWLCRSRYETRGYAGNVERVIEVLRKAGVEIVNEPTRAVRLIPRK